MTARWAFSLVVLVIVGCASGRSGDGVSPDGQRPDGAGGKMDGPPATDASVDAPRDAPPVDSSPGGGLDPDLELPDPSGQVCDEPGRIGPPECPSAEVCRYFTPTEGRCESCTACGNLGASCTASDQCDILFVCYQGQCTNFCTLGTTECGAPTDCIDIGHATRGACRP